MATSYEDLLNEIQKQINRITGDVNLLAQAKAAGMTITPTTSTEEAQKYLASKQTPTPPPPPPPPPTPTPTPTPPPTTTPTSTTTSTTSSTYTGVSIVDYLKSIGQPSDFDSRAKLAQQYGIQNYTGTAEQNTQLLNLLRSGAKPVSTTPTTTPTTGATGTGETKAPTTLYEYYTQQGKTLPSISDRAVLYQKYGLGPATEYVGTAEQNTKLLNALLKSGGTTTSLPSGLGGASDITSISDKIQEGEVDVNKEILDETAYLTNIKNLQDLKASLGIGEAPAAPSLTQTYLSLRDQYNIGSIENQLANLNKQIADVQASFQLGLYTQEGKLAPMTLIGTRQRELARQAQEQLDALNREKAVLVDEYNTKMNLISTIMNLTNTDYQNARQQYDSAFSQNIQLQELLISSADKAQDNARADLTTIVNLAKDYAGGIIPDDIKALMDKLSLQAGIPAGIMEYFLQQKPGADLKAHGTGTDAEGNEFVYMIYQNADGTFGVSRVYTGGVSASSTKGLLSDTQKNKILSLPGFEDWTKTDIDQFSQSLKDNGIEVTLNALDGATESQKTLIRAIIGGKSVETIEDRARLYVAEGYTTRSAIENKWYADTNRYPTAEEYAVIDKVLTEMVPSATTTTETSTKKPWWKFW